MEAVPSLRVVYLTREEIEVEKICREIVHPACGALLTFQGTVRNEQDGKAVEKIFYEVYESLAKKQLEAIAERISERWGIHRIALVHRVEWVNVGETSVFIALASPHRLRAFEALSFAIEQVKTTVPIWKKEFFSETESHWVQGHTFQWK